MKLKLLVLVGVVSLAGVGCGPPSNPKLSSEQSKLFKGGPMPADAWKHMAEDRARYAREHGGGGTTTAPQAAPEAGSGTSIGKS